MDNNRGLVIFGLGCAAGAVAALVLTSKSGRETVEYLRGKAEEGTKTVRDSVDNLSEAVTSAATRATKTVKYQAENVGAALDAGKKAFRAAQDMTP